MQSRIFLKDILKTIEAVIDYYSQEIGIVKSKASQDVGEVAELETRIGAFEKVRAYFQSDDPVFIKIIKEVLNRKSQSQEQSDADIPFHEASEAPTEVSVPQLGYDTDTGLNLEVLEDFDPHKVSSL